MPARQPGQGVKLAPPLEGIAGPTVTVNAFRLQGNKLLSDAQLAPVLAPFLNRPLNFRDLQSAALAVSMAYRQAGWIVRAYLPRQDIDNGVVVIQVVEAAFGKVRFDGTPGRIDSGRLPAYVERAQPKGSVVNADALDRAILLIDDLPGVAATGSLAAGEGENETDLVVKLSDDPLVSGDAGIDNTSARSTGPVRATANLYLNSPLQIGDLAGINLLHSDGSDYVRLGYTLPLGAGGWRAGVNGSALRYRLVADEFEALHAHGISNTLGAEASYPLIRSRTRNLFLQLNYDDRHFDNQAEGATTSHYRISGASIGLNGNLFDEFGGGGASTLSLFLSHGRVDLDGSPNREADAATTAVAGGFTKLRYSLSRQQALGENLNLSLQFSGQAASKNLDSSEKFYLGGFYGVRAYPSSEAGGSTGQLLNLDLTLRLARSLSLGTFYDRGHVKVNRDNGFAGAALVNDYSLQGAGVSLNWAAASRLNLKAVWARRIGSNPNPTNNGSDQDGSLHKNRFWLQATMGF